MKKLIKIFAAICVLAFACTSADAQLSITISANIAPPALPVYVQPACPTDGYIWQPGYWAYDDADGYYWVPGVWVAAPQPGYLWTPAYWGYGNGVYGFHAGYWGLHVGFYGGINYGGGYGGWGYGGGHWEGGHFAYNTAVVNVNTTVVHNTYIDRTVVNNTYVNNHTSFNGAGGVTASPRPEEQAAMREQHLQPTQQQMNHQQHASQDRNQFASTNGGHPAAAAMNRVGGRPFDSQGHVSTNSNLGANRNRSANGAAPNNRPAGNAPNGQHQQPGQQPQQRPAQQHAQQPNQQRGQQQHRGGGQPRQPRNNPHQGESGHEKH